MLYRVLERLSMPGGRMIEPGTLDTLEGLPGRVIGALLERGRIGQVSAPPLRLVGELFGRDYSEQLESIGLVDLADLVTAGPGDIAAATGLSQEEARHWQDRARSILTLSDHM